jgi:hypothetical protein
VLLYTFLMIIFIIFLLKINYTLRYLTYNDIYMKIKLYGFWGKVFKIKVNIDSKKFSYYLYFKSKHTLLKYPKRYVLTQLDE